MIYLSSQMIKANAYSSLSLLSLGRYIFTIVITVSWQSLILLFSLETLSFQTCDVSCSLLLLHPPLMMGGLQKLIYLLILMAVLGEFIKFLLPTAKHLYVSTQVCRELTWAGESER